MILNDTIAAIATPPGKGAIAVIRVSGPESISTIEMLFKGSSSLEKASANTLLLGHFYADRLRRMIVDQVMVCKFVAPHSYTGENVVEIHCHGGSLVSHTIMKTLIKNGVRLAEPGEFTKRAFLNGKMDLAQAEAVADIINSQTEASLKLAQSQRNRRLSKKLFDLQEQLKHSLMMLEIELDFSEEDIQFAERAQLSKAIQATVAHVDELIRTFAYGKIIREGLRVALVGRPNVGKSSILNRLLEEDRAIVSVIPGTTRDSIEEALDIGGYLFKVTDTAGIRQSADEIEQQGVQRTMTAVEHADFVLMNIDATDGVTEQDISIFQNIASTKSWKNIILIINKIDVKQIVVPKSIAKKFTKILHISAKTGEGFRRLEQALVQLYENEGSMPDAVINKVRHFDALQKTKEDLNNALRSLHDELSPEFISLDLRSAVDHLGQITGKVTTEDILNDIFSKFCIGK